MAKEPPPAPLSKAQEKTHLVVRAPGGKFRRAGLTFTGDHSVFSLDDLGAAAVKAIEAEPSLEARRISTLEAERFKSGKLPGDDDKVTKAELRQWLAQEKARGDRAEAEVAKLKAQLIGDRPPTNIDDLPGGRPPGQ